MGSQLPPGPSQVLSHGPRPNRSQEQATGAWSQRKVSTFQNWLPSSRVEVPRLTYSFKVKHFLKTSVVRIEDRLLKRLFGESSGSCCGVPGRSAGLGHVGPGWNLWGSQRSP